MQETQETTTNTPSTSAKKVSEFKSRAGWRRLISALDYSLQGLASAWREEHAFRQELFLFVPLSLLALFLPLSGFEKLILISVLVLILIMELINSAIEAVVDRVSLERHELSKKAKDYGSAAVFLSMLIAIATWGVVLFNRFYF